MFLAAQWGSAADSIVYSSFRYLFFKFPPKKVKYIKATKKTREPHFSQKKHLRFVGVARPFSRLAFLHGSGGTEQISTLSFGSGSLLTSNLSWATDGSLESTWEVGRYEVDGSEIRRSPVDTVVSLSTIIYKVWTTSQVVVWSF